MNKPYINKPQMFICLASITVGAATGYMWPFCGSLYAAC